VCSSDLVQQKQGNYQQALPYYEQSLAFFETQDRPHHTVSVLGTLGKLHTEYQSWEQGITFLRQALEMTRSLDNPDQQASLLNHLAEAYRQQEQLAQAMQYYEQALQLDQTRLSASTRLHSLTGAGATACDLAQIRAAQGWLEEAQQWLAQRPADPHDRLHLQQELAKFYKLSGDYAKAMAHFEIADQLEDSLLNVEKLNRLSELQVRYETERKDREIAHLQYQKASQQASLLRQTWQKKISFGLLLAVVLVLGLVFRYYRLKQHHQLVLLSKEQELNAAKSRFFSDIAHELRSPLTLIQGPAEQILSGSSDSNHRRHAKMIKKQSERLLHLVNQVLYLSRLEAGVIALQRTEQDLVAFLRAMVHAFESKAEQQEVNLKFSSTASHLILPFDQDKFEKIIINLLNNAFKFTPPWGTISLELNQPQPDQVIILVRDTGQGISAEHLPRIFDRYYTASGTHKDASGAGIGLSLTKELAWQAADPDQDSLRYDVLLFTSQNATPLTIASQTTDTTLAVRGLQYQTVYFWQVIAQDEQGAVTRSEVWSFATQAFPRHRIFFTSDRSGNSDIYSVDQTGTTVVQRTQRAERDVQARMSPLRHRLAFVSEVQGARQLFTMEPDGHDLRQITQVPLAGFHNTGTGYTWSPDGSQLLYAHYHDLYQINADGSGLQRIAEAPLDRNFREMDWTSQGNQIIVQTVGARIYDTELYLFSPGSDSLRRLVGNHPGQTASPSFSVDGKQVLFTHDASGFRSLEGRQLDSRIYLISVEGSEWVDLSVNKPAGTNDLRPRFSPDGASIIFENSSNDGQSPASLWIMDHDGSNRRLLQADAYMPDWR